jgi:hypothetical protein
MAAPLPSVFRAIVTSLAGYWKPSRSTRAWQQFFFLVAWIQEWIPIAARIPGVGTGPRTGTTRS